MNPPGHSLGNNLSSPYFRYNRRYHHIYLTSCFSDDAEYRSPSCLPPQRSIVPPRPSFHNPTVISVLKALGTCLCVALGLLASARPADAGFNATLNSVSRDSSNNYVTLAVQNTDSNNAFNFSNVTAGRLNWTASSSVPGLTGSGNTFGTFCIEIPQHVSLNSAYDFTQKDLNDLPTSRNPVMGLLKGAQIQAVWAAWHGSIVVTGNATATATNYAAFQVAIWEIVYDNSSTSSYDVITGNFIASSNSTVTSQANTYLATVSGSAFDANNVLKKNGTALARANVVGFEVRTGSNGEAQDQIAVVAPAPPAVVLLLSGLVPFLAFRRRLLNRTA